MLQGGFEIQNHRISRHTKQNYVTNLFLKHDVLGSWHVF